MSSPATKRAEPPVVPSATNLPASAEDDQRQRQRQYLISMAIRTLCFIAAVLLWAPLRWASIVCLVLSAVLPYVAVVLANATGKRKIDVAGSVEPGPVPHKEIRGSTASHR